MKKIKNKKGNSIIALFLNSFFDINSIPMFLNYPNVLVKGRRVCGVHFERLDTH